MTLVTVLLLGLGAVLVVSAIETDPTTGRSVPIFATIAQIWNDQLDIGQPSGPPEQSPGVHGPTPSEPGGGVKAGSGPSYQEALTLAYIQRQQQRGF